MSFKLVDRSGPKPPRNGHRYVVGIVCRISGCQNQKEVSLEDQADHGREVAVEIFGNAHIEYRIISTKGKGERLDREELFELEGLLRSRTLDLLIAEDLGRIVRGAEAVPLLGLAVDQGTRVVSPNDVIDTNDDDWEADAMEACKEHLQHNSQVSKRLKHKLMNRFLKFGGAPAREIFGYIVDESAKTYQDWRKDDAAEPILKKAYQMLMDTLNYTAVADWLNEQKVPVGPYCRNKTWDRYVVRRLFRNPILIGKPGRGFKHTIKHHETGRRIAVRNPKGPKFYDCPHLAYFTEEELALLNAKLDEKNLVYRRSADPERDPLLRVPRKRTRFPGQHARCIYCGRDYVWGGNGITSNLMCAGVQQRRCWNSIGFNGELAAHNIADAMVNIFNQLSGFEDQFREMVQQARESDNGSLTERYDRLVAEEAKLTKEKQNLVAAIQEFGPMSYLKDKIAEIEERERRQIILTADLDRLRTAKGTIPSQLGDIWGPLKEELARLTVDSTEFGDLMRRLVPEFDVYLVRLCDGGHLLPRARVRLNLGGAIEGLAAYPDIVAWLSSTISIDLFIPPQRERIRIAAAAQLAANPKMTYAEITSQLPEKATETAVGYALALHRTMQEMGMQQPYVILREPPTDYTKLRRHLHRLYRFEPLPGYQPPEF